MKKIVICLVIISVFSLFACQSTSQNVNSSNNTEIHNPEPGFGMEISIHSLDELNCMREMISCTNTQEINSYIKKIKGNARSKEDLIRFVNLVDSIPYSRMIDGNISWISYSAGQSQDTGEEYEILYITTKSTNGDWMRYEYVLSVTDVSGRIKEEINKLTTTSLITQPMRSSDERITFFSETRVDHPSGIGEIIKWNANMDGVYTRIVYYTSNAKQANTNTILSNSSVTNIKTEIK